MVIPIGVSPKSWFDSLVIDFPNDNIPVLNTDEDWKVVGGFLIQENSFSIQGSPSTDGFDEFESWAMRVFITMNNF